MYGGYYGYGYYWDPTYFLVLVGLVLCLGASALVNSTMRKYSKVRNMRGLTGAEAARNILNREGLYNVQIECLNSDDGDHYDPRTDTVRLSYNNFNGTSVTAVSVAAHECGHAIQHAHGYAPMSIRAALVPVVNIGSNLSIPLIFFRSTAQLEPDIDPAWYLGICPDRYFPTGDTACGIQCFPQSYREGGRIRVIRQ